MDTLVLSHAYEPVARVGWQRAICLLWEGKVEVIEQYEDRTVRVPCNQRKGGRTPEEAGMHLRSIPVKPKSLPEALRLTFLFDKNVPPSWRQFAHSYHYWQDELEGGGP
jgi:5-methylcytosine-specific restriction endonuclease McrA